MLHIVARADSPSQKPQLGLTLPFELRQRSRLRAKLDHGEDAALQLPRGSVLRGGDLLLTSDGRVVMVRAAAESVSTARTHDGTLLARAAYHLGNRHVPLELGDGFVRYAHDHVLDEMVRQLGLEVICEQTPFEPEAGAYGHAGHGHGHPHSHASDTADPAHG